MKRGIARCAENKKDRELKMRNSCNNCVSISHSRRVWDVAKSDVPLCAENEKMAGKIGFFNVCTDIFPLSAGVTDGFMSSVAMGR